MSLRHCLRFYSKCKLISKFHPHHPTPTPTPAPAPAPVKLVLSVWPTEHQQTRWTYLAVLSEYSYNANLAVGRHKPEEVSFHFGHITIPRCFGRTSFFFCGSLFIMMCVVTDRPFSYHIWIAFFISFWNMYLVKYASNYSHLPVHERRH